jgi:hypothetical protein
MVTQVLVPGAIINAHQCHHKHAFEAFGSVPFNLVCLKSRLKVITSGTNIESMSFTRPSSNIFDPPSLQSQPLPAILADLPSSTTINPEQDGLSISDLIFDQAADTTEVELEPNNNATSLTLNHKIDQESATEGASILGPKPTKWTTVRSQVINDPFYLFNHFYIAAGHGLHAEFGQAMCDALFIPDEEDKHRITTWGQSQKPPQTFDTLVRSRPAWVWKHCKQVIPPPEELYPLVASVFRIYGPLKDTKAGQPLFNSRAWHIAKNILVLIQGGYVSDPPRVALYTLMGSDSANGGLLIYWCA